MKRFLVVFLILGMVAGSVFAEDGLTFSGEVKTGLNITKDGDNDPVAQIKHTDDAGTPGRVRMNFNWVKGNVQFKSRFEVTGSDSWGDFKGSNSGGGDQGFVVTQDRGARFLKYAYAMGDFVDNQIRMSLGKIGGDKPWETGGDEIWASIEEITGARFEFKPNAVQGLNIGFLLPAVVAATGGEYDPSTNTYSGRSFGAPKLGDYFQEVGFGARYENDMLDARLAFRLDGRGDDEGLVYIIEDATKDTKGEAGARLLYRLNIKAIGGMVPGLSLWFNGRFDGIATNSGVPDGKLNTVNWLYAKYASGSLTSAALRLGLETWHKENENARQTALYIKPVFGYKVTDWAEVGLEVRADLVLGYDEGYKVAGNDPSMLDNITVYPSVNFDLGNGASIKPVYILDFRAANGPSAGKDEAVLKHQFEIRLQYSF